MISRGGLFIVKVRFSSPPVPPCLSPPHPPCRPKGRRPSACPPHLPLPFLARLPPSPLTPPPLTCRSEGSVLYIVYRWAAAAAPGWSVRCSACARNALPGRSTSPQSPPDLQGWGKDKAWEGTRGKCGGWSLGVLHRMSGAEGPFRKDLVYLRTAR